MSSVQSYVAQLLTANLDLGSVLARKLGRLAGIIFRLFRLHTRHVGGRL